MVFKPNSGGKEGEAITDEEDALEDPQEVDMGQSRKEKDE